MKFPLITSLICLCAFFSCAPQKKVTKIIKTTIRDTVIVNTVTEKFESARIAKLNKFKVSTSHYPSYGQDERVRFLILHYTAMNDEGSLRVLTQKDVSSHYLIPNDYSDSLYVLVDETKRSWHAGVSFWKGVNNLNFSSIGIEIVNLGYTTSNPISGNPDLAIAERIFYDFPSKQIEKVAELSLDIIKRYNIDPVNVLAHSDIAPQRKHDPGPKFPWKELFNQYGIGAWYEDVQKTIFMGQYPYADSFSTEFILSVQLELEKYGYEIQKTGIWDEQTKKVITAFQYHFRPENYNGVLDAETWAILKALNLKYRS